MIVDVNVEEVLPGLTFAIPDVELKTIELDAVKVELLPLVLALPSKCW